MSVPRIVNAMEYIDDDLVSGAVTYTRTKKKNSWLKWGVMAACLCLVVGLAIPLAIPMLHNAINPPPIEEKPEGFVDVNSQATVEMVILNGVEYVVCGEGEANILQECGLPTEISKDLAGKHLGYLEQKQKNIYHISDSIKDGDIELFEYAPQPNDNVFIVCVDGTYYAAIRKDGNGYHGLSEDDPFEE